MGSSPRNSGADARPANARLSASACAHGAGSAKASVHRGHWTRPNPARAGLAFPVPPHGGYARASRSRTAAKRRSPRVQECGRGSGGRASRPGAAQYVARRNVDAPAGRTCWSRALRRERSTRKRSCSSAHERWLVARPRLSTSTRRRRPSGAARMARGFLADERSRDQRNLPAWYLRRWARVAQYLNPRLPWPCCRIRSSSASLIDGAGERWRAPSGDREEPFAEVTHPGRPPPLLERPVEERLSGQESRAGGERQSNTGVASSFRGRLIATIHADARRLHAERPLSATSGRCAIAARGSRAPRFRCSTLRRRAYARPRAILPAPSLSGHAEGASDLVERMSAKTPIAIFQAWRWATEIGRSDEDTASRHPARALHARTVRRRVWWLKAGVALTKPVQPARQRARDSRRQVASRYRLHASRCVVAQRLRTSA